MLWRQRIVLVRFTSIAALVQNAELVIQGDFIVHIVRYLEVWGNDQSVTWRIWRKCCYTDNVPIYWQIENDLESAHEFRTVSCRLCICVCSSLEAIMTIKFHCARDMQIAGLIAGRRVVKYHCLLTAGAECGSDSLMGKWISQDNNLHEETGCWAWCCYHWCTKPKRECWIRGRNLLVKIKRFVNIKVRTVWLKSTVQLICC